MKLVGVVLVVLAAGCFEDRYQCTTDAQCDLGAGGRCESNGSCTSFDLTCSTNYRYTTHAGELTNACYDDRTTLLNPCAGGQGPASAEGCMVDVCARLPACCDVAWTDACVQVAQEECDLACDTRIAITATRNATTELWDARWDRAGGWTITRVTDPGAPLSWVAPAPGTAAPRLAGANATSLVIGDTAIEVGGGRSYQAISSVSFDRHNADTIAASYSSSSGNAVELWRLDDLTVRDEPVPASQNLTWGDKNRDGFVDAVVKNGNTYTYLENLAVAFTRKLSNTASANVSGGVTPGSAGVRAIDWLDFNRDQRLDLAVFGNSVRIHTDVDGLTDIAQRELDCNPPTLARSCDDDPEPDLESVSFVGAALPTRDEPAVVMAPFPGRKLWRAHMQGDAFMVAQLAFPGDGCSCQANCNNNTCPGSNCTCNYDCATCVPILAIVSRDLDGDRRLDLVAIDARLRIYNALAKDNFAWTGPETIPTTFANTFFSVAASVSGALNP